MTENEWPTSTRTMVSAKERMQDAAAQAYTIDFGSGVEYDTVFDVLTLKTGANSDLSIRPGRRLAEVIAAGFAAMDERDAAEKRAVAPGATTCPYCGKAIQWVRIDQRWHPTEARASKHGTIVMVSSKDGEARMLLAGAEPTGKTYESHVGNCLGMAEGDNRWLGPPR